VSENTQNWILIVLMSVVIVLLGGFLWKIHAHIVEHDRFAAMIAVVDPLMRMVNEKLDADMRERQLDRSIDKSNISRE
jgi:undecaprenyl pyrophosphate phosphatase UppP